MSKQKETRTAKIKQEQLKLSKNFGEKLEFNMNTLEDNFKELQSFRNENNKLKVENKSLQENVSQIEELTGRKIEDYILYLKTMKDKGLIE